jgi:hypothetical protein
MGGGNSSIRLSLEIGKHFGKGDSVLVLRCNAVDADGQTIVSHVIIDVLTGERVKIRRRVEQIREAIR